MRWSMAVRSLRPNQLARIWRPLLDPTRHVPCCMQCKPGVEVYQIYYRRPKVAFISVFRGASRRNGRNLLADSFQSIANWTGTTPVPMII